MWNEQSRKASAVSRSLGLNKARAQFERDLQQDPDFQQFKKKAVLFNDLFVATRVDYQINKIGITTEQLIKSSIK